MQRVHVLIVIGLLSAAGAYVGYTGLERRLQQLELAPRVDPSELRALREQIVLGEARIVAAQEELERLRGTPEVAQALDARLRDLSGELASAARALRNQDARLADWEACRDEIGPQALDARIAGYRVGLESEVRKVDELARAAIDLARSSHDGLDRVTQDLARDGDRMWRELVGPTVQLMGEDTVGSGVLLVSEPVGDRGEFRTLLLTAWHVVRDIRSGAADPDDPIPVTIYAPDKSTTAETAELLEHDIGLDVALLKLNTTRRIECGARLAPRERLQQARIFDRIYAVGCPLGNDPIPTWGEIADTHHAVDGQRYWMISAPTYIGNSGGGIFDAKTHELLGIFCKIYTHGAVRPTVVPHMGLVTSLQHVYDWLDKTAYAHLEPGGVDVKPQTASVRR